MDIEISSVISIYELIAIAIAILIPAVQLFYKHILCSPKLNYFATKYITLYFHAGGPQICLCGIYEVKNKSTIVRNISMVIKHEETNETYQLEWDSLLSPQVQHNVTNTMIQGSVHSGEMAHPFKVQSNEVQCANPHFKNATCSLKLSDLLLNLDHLAHDAQAYVTTPNLPENTNCNTYALARFKYQTHPQYSETKQYLESIFLWKQGKYTATINTEYEKRT